MKPQLNNLDEILTLVSWVYGEHPWKFEDKKWKGKEALTIEEAKAQLLKSYIPKDQAKAEMLKIIGEDIKPLISRYNMEAVKAYVKGVNTTKELLRQAVKDWSNDE